MTRQTKYDNIKENLKGAKRKLAKSKGKIASLEKATVDLNKEARKEHIQSSEYEKHIGQVIDTAAGDMIFIIFLKHSNLDYTCLGEAVVELVVGYKQNPTILLKMPK